MDWHDRLADDAGHAERRCFDVMLMMAMISMMISIFFVFVMLQRLKNGARTGDIWLHNMIKLYIASNTPSIR